MEQRTPGAHRWVVEHHSPQLLLSEAILLQEHAFCLHRLQRKGHELYAPGGAVAHTLGGKTGERLGWASEAMTQLARGVRVPSRAASVATDRQGARERTL